ncbi:hypothetical protein CR513_28178, partial [Mucuna pruriens]
MANSFQRGKVDTTLFYKNYDSHFIISQYVKELLKKFNLEYCITMSTPMHPISILSLDEINKKID